MNFFVNCICCSFAQVLLQKNRVAGIFFIIGIGCNSLIMLIGGIIAITTSMLIAKFLRFDNQRIKEGFYTYNSALLGIGCFYFYHPSLLTIFIVIVSALVSTLITHLMFIRSPNTSIYTIPFVSIMWMIFLIVELLNVDLVGVTHTQENSNYIYSVPLGLAQVMFQEHWISGVFFTVGLLYHSKKLALYAIFGSFIGMVVAYFLGFAHDQILLGYYGYNTSLVFLVLAERYNKNLWLILFSAILCVLLTRATEELTIPSLTSPFILTSWIVIFIMERITKQKS